MKITAGTLFLAFAVVLNSIELISSTGPPLVTLAQLFPGYQQHGYLPTITIIVTRLATGTPEFGRIGAEFLHRPRHGSFLARGRLIFGWQGDHRNYINYMMGDYVEPLWRLFQPHGTEKCWVFDTNSRRWLTLTATEYKKLGFGYRMTLVVMQLDTAKKHELKDTNARAHRYAYHKANHQIDSLQANEARAIDNGQKYIDESSQFIGLAYQHAYDMAFHEYTDQSG